MKRTFTVTILLLGIIMMVQAQNSHPLTQTIGGTGWDRANVTRVIGNEILIAGASGSWDGDFDSSLPRPQDMFVVKTDLAGNVIWKKRIGGNKVEMAWDLIGTADGGYVVVGYTNSTDGHTSGSGFHGGTGSDVWVVKLGRTGNIIWQRAYGGSRNDEGLSIIQTDDDGDGQKDDGFILTGHTSSNDHDVTGHNGRIDAWVVKIDPNGNLQWQKTLGGTQHEYARGVIQTPDGGYVVIADTWSSNGDVTGYHQDPDGTPNHYGDWWLVKLSRTGEIEWKRTYGGYWTEIPEEIQLTDDDGDGVKDDGFIVVGHTESYNGDVPMPRYGQYDMLVVKFDLDANIQWQQRIGGKDHERGTSIVQTLDGGYAAIANCLSAKTGNLGDTKPKGDYDILLVKFDAAGNILSKDRFGGSGRDEALSIAQGPGGCLVIVGGTESTDGDASGNHGGMDAMVVNFCAPVPSSLPVKLVDFKANLLTDKVVLQWNTSSEQNNDRFEIQRSTDGGEFVTIGTVKGHGTTDIPRNYAYHDNGVYALSSEQAYYRLRQVDSDGKSNLSPVVVVKLRTKNAGTVRVWPNPSDGLLQIQLKNSPGSPVRATVYNANGQVVMSATLLKANNELNLRGKNSGTYFIRLDDANGLIEVKQIVLK